MFIKKIRLNTDPTQYQSPNLLLEQAAFVSRTNLSITSKQMQKISQPGPHNNKDTVFMIQRRITHPSTLDLKILTKIQDNIPTAYKPLAQFLLAQIAIYTDRCAYQGNLTGICIAKQLSWNAESLLTLTQCLMGKRDKVQMRFYPKGQKNQTTQKATKQFLNLKSIDSNQQANYQKTIKKQKITNNLKEDQSSNYQFEIICEISSGINLTLFQVEMVKSSARNSFTHMKQKFTQMQSQFRIIQQRHMQKEEKLRKQLNEIQAIERQIIDSSIIEINVMKSNFIKIINQCKLEIRKLVGTMPTINPLSGLVQTKNPREINIRKIPQENQEDEQYRQANIRNKRFDKAQKNRAQYNERSQQSQNGQHYKNFSENKREDNKGSTRSVRKVNRQAYQSVQHQKMQIQEINYKNEDFLCKINHVNSQTNSQQQRNNFGPHGAFNKKQKEQPFSDSYSGENTYKQYPIKKNFEGTSSSGNKTFLELQIINQQNQENKLELQDDWELQLFN